MLEHPYIIIIHVCKGCSPTNIVQVKVWHIDAVTLVTFRSNFAGEYALIVVKDLYPDTEFPIAWIHIDWISPAKILQIIVNVTILYSC